MNKSTISPFSPQNYEFINIFTDITTDGRFDIYFMLVFLLDMMVYVYLHKLSRYFNMLIQLGLLHIFLKFQTLTHLQLRLKPLLMPDRTYWFGRVDIYMLFDGVCGFKELLIYYILMLSN